jgi:hypothetical protein
LDQGLTAPCRDERLRQRQLVMNRAIACTWLGDTDMLELIEQPIAEPEADEVRVRVHTMPIRSSTWTFVRRDRMSPGVHSFRSQVVVLSAAQN